MNQKLKELIEFGADIEFRFRGKDYTILPWTDEGIVIGENNGEDSVFDSYEDMVSKYIVDGHVMKDILADIEITFTSGY